MSLVFKPLGTLDLNSDPSSLEVSGSGSNIIGSTMQRCKNLRLDIPGEAKLRYGSAKLSSTQMSGNENHIREQMGSRYVFGTSIYEDEVSIGSGYAKGIWSSVLYNAYNSLNLNIFALNGNETVRIQDGVVYNWGIEVPPIEMTVEALDSLTGLTGTYNAKITFARYEGGTVVYESNPSEAAETSAVLVDQGLKITIEYDSFGPLDPQATHVRLYRTTADGLLYYFEKAFEIDELVLSEFDYAYTADFEESDAYISGTGYLVSFHNYYLYRGVFDWEEHYKDSGYFDYTNPRTSYSGGEDIVITTNVADSALGVQVVTDRYPPPVGSLVLGPNYNGYIFIIYKNLIYFSLPKQPEYWPPTYYVEVSSLQHHIKSATFYNGQLYVATVQDIFAVLGTGAETFFPVKQAAITGAIGPNTMYGLDGVGIFHVGNDGLYLYSSSVGDRKISADRLDRIFRGETVNDVPGAGDLTTSWIVQFNNKVYFGYPDSTNTYPQHVLVYELTNKKIVYYDFGIEIPHITVDITNQRLICIDANGYSWELEKASVTTDDGTAISWEIESQNFTLQTRAHFPRWIKYDVNAQNANSVTGAIVLDGTVLQSHTVTGNRSTKRRLVTTGNGERCSMRLTGTGPVSVYAMESE